MDHDLVEAARRGDRTAFADLIRPRGHRLYGIACRVIRDADVAEDAIQDALVRAWKDLPGLRDPDRFDAWLHRVVVRTCVDAAVRSRRAAINVRAVPEPDLTASDELAAVADRDQLERGFRRLHPNQRAVLVLRHYAGMDVSQIAAVLGIPEGTVKSRLHNAHRAMRAALEADARSTAIGGQVA